jgi:hypothetical protein
MEEVCSSEYSYTHCILTAYIHNIISIHVSHNRCLPTTMRHVQFRKVMFLLEFTDKLS